MKIISSRLSYYKPYEYKETIYKENKGKSGANTASNSRLSSAIGEYSNNSNSRFTYPIGEISRTSVTSSSNYPLPPQVPYPPTNYNYDYIYSPTSVSNNINSTTNTSVPSYYDYVYTTDVTRSGPNYDYYRSQVVNRYNTTFNDINNGTNKEVVSLPFVENEIPLKSGNGKFTLVFKLVDLDRIEKV
jgi:hypothetical protein